MENILTKIGIILSFSLLLSSCQRTFDEINTDTSKITQPSAGSLLAPIQYEMGSYGYKRANDFTFQIMQVATPFPNEGNTVSRYYITESTGNGFWNTSYRWLKQAQLMHDIAIRENNKNYQAIALVMKAWMFSNLTDAFGDIPYSEALRLEENISKPQFDTQKDIYLSILQDLKKANSLFVINEKLSETDLFYNAHSDINGTLKWKKFCNSLSIRLLTRISKRNGEIDVISRLQEILKNPTEYPIFQGIEDSVVLPLSGAAPYLAPIVRPQDFTTGKAASEFFVEVLKANQDPRISSLFTQARRLSNNKAIGYQGAPSGYALGTTFTYQPSNFQQALAKGPLTLLIYPYSELQFTLSELALKGIITGDAKTYYENGVKSNLAQWKAEVPANYFTNPNVKYNGTLEQIMLQKYIALFFVDHQQWYEQRRTGFPILPNNGGLENDGKMPQRMLYPTSVRVMNTENYQNTAQQMGGDDINTLMWWNK